MNTLPYHSLPDIPDSISTTNVIARMIDGLAFRYRWATEGLTEADATFRPVESSMNMQELLEHIYDLAYGTNKTFGGNKEYDKTSDSVETLRAKTLDLYQELSERLKAMEEADLESLEVNKKQYPFWYWINGPIADALTHVGQVVSWRRIAGNPQPPGVNVFSGIKK